MQKFEGVHLTPFSLFPFHGLGLGTCPLGVGILLPVGGHLFLKFLASLGG